jgi:hypothetical protein
MWGKVAMSLARLVGRTALNSHAADACPNCPIAQLPNCPNSPSRRLIEALQTNDVMLVQCEAHSPTSPHQL